MTADAILAAAEAAAQTTATNPELWLGVEPKWWLFAIGLAGIVTVLFKADDSIEKRRRKAIRASAACGKIGLKRFEALFESYAVGDKTGATKDIHNLSVFLRKAGSIEEVATQVIETAGPALLEHPIYGERVRKALAPKAKLVTPVNVAPTKLDATLH